MSHTRRRAYRFFSVALAALRRPAFARTVGFDAPALRRLRGSGLGEVDARLIIICELDTGGFERAADRKFISNGEGSP